MFNPGTPAEDVFRQQSFDHNLTGLEAYTSAADIYSDGYVAETTGHAFLDEIPVGKSLLDQFKEATQMDGAVDGEGEFLYRRLTMKRRRSASDGSVIVRRVYAASYDGAVEATPFTIYEDETATPPATPEPAAMGILSPKVSKGKGRALPNMSVMSESRPIRPTIGRSYTAPLPLANHSKERHSSSSDHGLVFSETDVPRLLLYNWFLLRMDNIKILSQNEGVGEDFGLLKLLANTHEDRRWWTVMIDDLACPQCVEVLRKRRTNSKARYMPKIPGATWVDNAQRLAQKRQFKKCSKNVHCDGGLCKIVCEHRDPEANNVTRFFHKLGLSTAARMRNILLETAPSTVPSADHLVSCVHNVGYYFPDVQNLEICFHFENLPPDKDTWTRMLCCLVELENFLPKGAHLRVKGMEAHTELMCGWARKGRRWHHGRDEKMKVDKFLRGKEGRGRYEGGRGGV